MKRAPRSVRSPRPGGLAGAPHRSGAPSAAAAHPRLPCHRAPGPVSSPTPCRPPRVPGLSQSPVRNAPSHCGAPPPPPASGARFLAWGGWVRAHGPRLLWLLQRVPRAGSVSKGRCLVAGSARCPLAGHGSRGRRGLWVRALASSGLQPSGTPCSAHLPVCFGAGGGEIFSQGPGCLARASYLQLKVCSGSLQDPPAKEAPGKGGRGRLRATTVKSPLLPAAPRGLGSQQGARSSLTWGKAAPEGGGWKGVPGAQPSPSCRGHATEGRPPGSPASPRADLQSSALSDETPGG